jgi:hypothetical protein
MVKVQAAKPARLEVWDDYGSPAERIASTDARWMWKGDWQVQPAKSRHFATSTRTSSTKGAEASVTFEGTGAIIAGSFLPTGGKADVHLDGKFDRTIDVFPDEDSPKHTEAIWHAFGLRSGRHTVRLVVRGEPYAGSRGAEINIEDLAVFR